MIHFNSPSIVGSELDYIRQAVELGVLSGEGAFARKCASAIQRLLGEDCHVMLTSSCTSALEMSALLLDIRKGDEVIMPSFTFVSTANAFALRGAKPVFADIDPITLNIRPSEIERLITKRTKAVVLVHYAGWPCDMDKIIPLLKDRNIALIEDAAHALGSTYRGNFLGTFGSLSTFSFHETKNITCGEGGALIINDPLLIDRAYIIRDKGTNRRQFQRGDAAFYAWVELGSSYVVSDVLAAFLAAQLEHLDSINERRLAIVRRYSDGLGDLRQSAKLSFPLSSEYPSDSKSNGHLFFILLESHAVRECLRLYLLENQVGAVFHYQPLHRSPFMTNTWGIQEALPVTENIADRLLRLPMYYQLSDNQVDEITKLIRLFFDNRED
jgi:dTDP-4-amino-4,6-dideoxygalactose transaminase